MTLLWCSSKFAQLYKLYNLHSCIVYILSIFHVEGWNIYNIYTNRTSLTLYTPDSVSLALLTRQLVMCSVSTVKASELA